MEVIDSQDVVVDGSSSVTKDRVYTTNGFHCSIVHVNALFDEVILDSFPVIRGGSTLVSEHPLVDLVHSIQTIERICINGLSSRGIEAT